MPDAGARPVLKREIGLFGATALGIGAIIGSGIFIVTGIVAGIAGPAMVFSIIIAGIIAVFSAMSIAELGAYLPEEGGTYAYAQKLISPFAGFIAGWIWIFSNIFVGAAVSLGFAHYFVTLFPAVPVKIIAIGICLLFLVINYIGLKESVLFNNLLVTAKVLILLFFVAFGLGFFRPGNFTPFAPEGSMGILSGAALIFFAYTGFARVTIMAEEVKHPEKTIPRSIYLALGISTVIYLLVSIVAVGLAGAPALANSGSPLADAVGMTGSPGAVLVIALGAMIATASVLLTTIMGISRIVFSMARSQDLPSLFERIHPRFSTPHYAIVITGACMIAAILLADLTLVVAVSTFAMLLYYLIANIAALRLPQEHRMYSPLVPIIGVLSCLGLIIFLNPDSWIIGCIGLLIGGTWFIFRRKTTR
ncbi:amino acid permease [Methanoregula sp.]|uniref:APC family permease n=1 Tax=Methanoregula sp. TaxID=2052170 RepID=UPI00237458FE|nr:amino acid permease [Methanoregula sp.]MDD1687842.1 amino acid permease [Methanoregula sp.]